MALLRGIRIAAELFGILCGLALFPVIVLCALPYLWWSERRMRDEMSQRLVDTRDK